MYTGVFDALLDTISKWPEFSVYHEKMSRFRKDLVEKWHQVLDVNPKHFNTLVHNDLWPPNVMIKGVNSSEVAPFENIIFIDFQNTLWGSPTLDLHLFLNMSVCESFKPNRFDELVEFYYSHLVNLLKQLKYNGHIPTWTEFHAQYLDRKLSGILKKLIKVVYVTAHLIQKVSVLPPNVYNLGNNYLFK